MSDPRLPQEKWSEEELEELPDPPDAEDLPQLEDLPGVEHLEENRYVVRTGESTEDV